MRQAGFRVTYTTSFLFLLLPLMIVSRLLNMKSKSKEEVNLFELDPPKFMNVLMYKICLIELNMLSVRKKLPFGGSLLILGIKE